MSASDIHIGKRLAQLKREVNSRGFDRHVSVLTAMSELPIDLKSPSETNLEAGEEVKTIIVFPPQIHRGRDYVAKQALLFTSTEVIHIQASIWPDKEPEVTRIKGCHLMYLNITLMLLYGFLEIMAHDHSLPVRLAVEFNTTS